MRSAIIFAPLELSIADPVTRINSILARFIPKLTVLFQRVYMKTSAIVFPVRRFRTFYGAEMTGKVKDFLVRRMCFFGFYEPSLTRFMMETIKPSQTVVDIGANIGYFTLLMSKLVGSGRVVAIEASPSTFEVLRNHLQANSAENVRSVGVAVADYDGQVQLSDGDPFNSGTRSIASNRLDARSISVPCDTLLSILGVDAERTSFIKMDIEGAERAPLLEILMNTHRFARPLTIVSEISPENRDLLEMFSEAGFEVNVLPNDYSWAAYLTYGRFKGNPLPLSERGLETDDYVLRLPQDDGERSGISA